MYLEDKETVNKKMKH